MTHTRIDKVVFPRKPFNHGRFLSLRSPGFGLTLVAETLNGTFLSAEQVSTPQGQGDPVLPEDLGRNCAKLLLEEIYRVGDTQTNTHTINRNPSQRAWCTFFVLVPPGNQTRNPGVASAMLYQLSHSGLM